MGNCTSKNSIPSDEANQTVTTLDVSPNGNETENVNFGHGDSFLVPKPLLKQRNGESEESSASTDITHPQTIRASSDNAMEVFALNSVHKSERRRSTWDLRTKYSVSSRHCGIEINNKMWLFTNSNVPKQAEVTTNSITQKQEPETQKKQMVLIRTWSGSYAYIANSRWIDGNHSERWVPYNPLLDNFTEQGAGTKKVVSSTNFGDTPPTPSKKKRLLKVRRHTNYVDYGTGERGEFAQRLGEFQVRGVDWKDIPLEFFIDQQVDEPANTVERMGKFVVATLRSLSMNRTNNGDDTTKIFPGNTENNEATNHDIERETFEKPSLRI